MSICLPSVTITVPGLYPAVLFAIYKTQCHLACKQYQHVFLCLMALFCFFKDSAFMKFSCAECRELSFSWANSLDILFLSAEGRSGSIVG